MRVDYSKLDVMVLTYNRAKNLSVMLESLCTQTANGFRIIVLNNASTDNTLEVIQKVREEYPERDIQVVTHKKNLGNIGNFKKSQELAKNEYTAVFHDDDAIHPEYIETAMKLLYEYPKAVLCSGQVHPLYRINNQNWDMLDKNYYLYPQEMGAYLQLHIGRANFQTAIYKSEVYKKVSYRQEKYGKLHDIIFLMEVSMRGPSILIPAICARMGVSPTQDSCRLGSGPFPEEVYRTIKRIDELTQDEVYAKPALWNFSYFLYTWADLSRYETWKEFVERMRDTVFTNKEILLYSRKVDIDPINEQMAIHAQKLCGSEGIFHIYEGNGRSGLEET